MKQEIYLQLLPIERQLKSAQQSNYARLSAAEFEKFCNLYKDTYGVELTRNEKNCNTCRLKAIKKIAKDYFEFQDWYLKRWGRRPEDPKPEKESEDSGDAQNDGATVATGATGTENNEENKTEE